MTRYILVVVVVASIVAGVSLSASEAGQSGIAATGIRLSPTPSASATSSATPTVIVGPEIAPTREDAGVLAHATTEVPQDLTAVLPTATSPRRNTQTFTPTLTPTPTPTVTLTSQATETRLATATAVVSATPVAATPVFASTTGVPPTATPAAPSATAAPSFRYIVLSVREVNGPASRNVAYIRVRLADRSGQLVPGTQFQIFSQGVPPFSAIEPLNQQGDGTAEFPVSRGIFTVGVVGDRSQGTDWLLTGVPSNPQMSDWEVVFQTTT